MLRRKRTRRPEARPDEILDAALAVFAEKGFAASRVDDVAKAAGLSKGAVYLYFPSKEALFEALVRRFAQEVVATVAGVLGAGEDDPARALRDAFCHIFARIADPAVSAAPRLVLAEAQRFPEIARFYRREVIALAEQAVSGLLAHGVQTGAFRPVQGDAALRALLGPIICHALLAHVFVDPDAPAPDPGATADALADLLLLGLTPRPDPSDKARS